MKQLNRRLAWSNKSLFRALFWVTRAARRAEALRFGQGNGGLQVHSSLLNVVLHD